MAYKSNAARVREFVAENYTALRDPEVIHEAIGTSFDDYYGQRPVRFGYINAYEITMGYGGPEEGGWWRTYHEPVAAIPVTSEAGANEAITKLDAWLEEQYGDQREYTSAAGGEDGVLRFEPSMPEAGCSPEGGYE